MTLATFEAPMPDAPRPGCSWPRCPNRATGRSSRCVEHERQYERERKQGRNYSQLHGSARWKQERLTFLSQPENAWCSYCAKRGEQVKAECVDHKTAAKGDARLFFDKSNWVPCCLTCNRKKAAASEGSFGRTNQDSSAWG